MSFIIMTALAFIGFAAATVVGFRLMLLIGRQPILVYGVVVAGLNALFRGVSLYYRLNDTSIGTELGDFALAGALGLQMALAIYLLISLAYAFRRFSDRGDPGGQ